MERERFDRKCRSSKKLELKKSRRKLRELLTASGKTLNELLVGLKEEREILYRECYSNR
ncbi:MAG: hypothetical protein HYS08_03795 [Chlamydiae bacterium]|nr:hypothetical protein [Chlamydiota bacterium]MBI3266919.1 hypothetical protein [Chlamydiota bacterium]